MGTSNIGIYDTQLDIWRWYLPTFTVQSVSGVGATLAPGSNGIPASTDPSWAVAGTSFSMRVKFELSNVPAGVRFASIETPPAHMLDTRYYNRFSWNEPVPEPGSLALLLTGLFGIAALGRHKRR